MTIKRKLHCENPNCPHEKILMFSDWVREKLPDSSFGFHVMDVDFIIRNRETKKLMLLEVKTNNGNVSDWQRDIIGMIHKSIHEGMKKYPEWEYKGYHFVKFDGILFKDDLCYFDNQIITEDQLIKILTF